MLPKQLMASITKRRGPIFSSSYISDPKHDAKHEFDLCVFLADDDSLETGREIIIISRKVHNAHRQDEDGYGYKDAEWALRSRVGTDFIKRAVRWHLENRNKPQLRFPEFSYEYEDIYTAYKELPKSLDEISRIMREAHLPAGQYPTMAKNT